MLAAQGGVCAICGRVPKMRCVDHDHDTGRVRAITCGPCNSGMGYFGDSAERLRAAADYLDQHRSV